MKRFFILSAFLATAFPAFAETTLTLKENITVSGDTIMLNDLLSRPVEQGKAAIFASPAPGDTGTITAARVMDAARTYGLDNISQPSWSAVQIKRDARTITQADIETVIRERAMKDLHVGADALDISFSRDISDLTVETSAEGPLQFSYFRLDVSSGRFEARLYVANSTILSEASPVSVLGSANEMADVVQLKNTVERGAMISKSDVGLVRIKKQQVNSAALHQQEDAVGMLAKRTLAENTMLRNSDVQKPKLVARNDMVLVVYKTPVMMVTTRAKVMMDGTMGDTVEIQNLQSKRSMTGVVSGSGQVTVIATLPSRIVQASTTP